jgi:hypothetical protein
MSVPENPPQIAGLRRLRPRLEEARRPQPFVDADRVDDRAPRMKIDKTDARIAS